MGGRRDEAGHRISTTGWRARARQREQWRRRRIRRKEKRKKKNEGVGLLNLLKYWDITKLNV